MVIRSTGYSIHTGTRAMKALDSFLSRNSFAHIYIVCDSNTLAHCVPLLSTSVPALREASIIEVEPGENSKSLEVCEGVWRTLAEDGAGRDILIVNCGGGVVSDAGGFCASVYKRGISFINVPTSLLAMCDASVGGKTGIDLDGIKNIIGTFSMPAGVFIDDRFLATLPPRQFKNGMAEVFKIALVSDGTFWKEITTQAFSPQWIGKSVALKNEIVKEDPKDAGRRNILNYGHTAGHAIESSGHDVLHGEAIAAGIIIENLVAADAGIMRRTNAEKVNSFLLDYYAEALPDVDHNALMRFMQNDKKQSSGKIRLSLVTTPGKCRHHVETDPRLILAAVDQYRRML